MIRPILKGFIWVVYIVLFISIIFFCLIASYFIPRIISIIVAAAIIIFALEFELVQKTIRLVDIAAVKILAKRKGVTVDEFLNENVPADILDYLDNHRFEFNGNRDYLKCEVRAKKLQSVFVESLVSKYNSPRKKTQE